MLSPGLSDSACESFKDCLPVWYSIVSIMDIKSFGFQTGSQDGGGIGWVDHFLFYKFIERTTEQ